MPRTYGYTRALTRGDAVCRDHFTGKHHGQRFLPLIVYKYLTYLRRKGKLPAPIQKALESLKPEKPSEGEEGEKVYQHIEKNIKVLLKTELPDDPAATYLQCLKVGADKEAFKIKYDKALVEHKTPPMDSDDDDEVGEEDAANDK